MEKFLELVGDLSVDWLQKIFQYYEADRKEKKYHLNRIAWTCYVDNPAIRGYRNFIKKHGGVECGHYRQNARLMDGRLHDSVEFEILAEEFVR